MFFSKPNFVKTSSVLLFLISKIFLRRIMTCEIHYDTFCYETHYDIEKPFFSACLDFCRYTDVNGSFPS